MDRRDPQPQGLAQDKNQLRVPQVRGLLVFDDLGQIEIGCRFFFVAALGNLSAYGLRELLDDLLLHPGNLCRRDPVLLVFLPGLAKRLLPHVALPTLNQPHQALGNLLGIRQLRDRFLNLFR